MFRSLGLSPGLRVLGFEARIEINVCALPKKPTPDAPSGRPVLRMLTLMFFRQVWLEFSRQCCGTTG